MKTAGAFGGPIKLSLTRGRSLMGRWLRNKKIPDSNRGPIFKLLTKTVSTDQPSPVDPKLPGEPNEPKVVLSNELCSVCL
jgi:hypothetical protein